MINWAKGTSSYSALRYGRDGSVYHSTRRTKIRSVSASIVRVATAAELTEARKVAKALMARAKSAP
jgi:hypothetical protein